MDKLDRSIINDLQTGFPVCDRPYQAVAERVGTSETELLKRLARMLDDGLLSRFGPLYNAEKMGGALTLCALSVPEDDFDAVTAKVNDFDQVAHNYRRDHRLNMWFVLATEFADEVETTIERIERATRLRVYNFPKLSEYYVGLRLDV